MNKIRYRMSACLSVLGMLGLTFLFAACGQRGVIPDQSETMGDRQADTEQPAAGQERNSSFDEGVITNSIGMKLTLIPAGEFLMGSPESEADRLDNEYQHKVRITKPFYLGVYEVTQAEYEKVMGENPSEFKGAANPVDHVSWDDATEFCKRLSAEEGETYRLPTEAEWEYACRAGTTTQYSFGDDPANLGEYAWYLDNSVERRRPVGEKKANAWGLHDMHGNVLEWCADWWASDYYAVSPTDDPAGPETSTYRVFRGGSWDYGGRRCRAAFRNRLGPGGSYNDLGFRVAAVPPEGQPSSSK